MLLFRRLLGVLLLAAGLALLIVGGWFAAFLGSSGTARFAVEGVGATPVVIEPSVLNRTALPVRITVTPASGSTATLVVGTPSDSAAILGDAEVDVVTGVAVRHKTAPVARRGTTGELDVATVDVWRSRQSVTQATTVTIAQDTAPETVVIVPARGGSLKSVTLSWSRSTWYHEALGLIAGGAALGGAGALLALRRGRPATDASGGAAGSATATPASGNATGEPPAGSPGASATPQVTS
ncbi:MAG: hypothetical protein U0Q21_06125 [Dermatophilaceae bacterium]|mgnify:CR=1 FL=1